MIDIDRVEGFLALPRLGSGWPGPAPSPGHPSAGPVDTRTPGHPVTSDAGRVVPPGLAYLTYQTVRCTYSNSTFARLM
jgi:hypothetical protein